METTQLLAELLALAHDAGIEVRTLRADAGGEGEPPAASGVCRVRGRVWVLLARADPPEAQVAVLARALREGAGAWLEGRWLPPAVRERLAGPPACADGPEAPGGRPA